MIGKGWRRRGEKRRREVARYPRLPVYIHNVYGVERTVVRKSRWRERTEAEAIFSRLPGECLRGKAEPRGPGCLPATSGYGRNINIFSSASSVEREPDTVPGVLSASAAAQESPRPSALARSYPRYTVPILAADPIAGTVALVDVTRPTGNASSISVQSSPGGTTRGSSGEIRRILAVRPRFASRARPVQSEEIIHLENQ